MSEPRIIIGHYVVTEPKEFQHCPSYYAADYEILRLVPGKYEMTVMFVGGYTCPMPYWLLASVDATRVEGALYSGFGGVNFSKTVLPAGESVQYGIQMNSHSLKNLIAEGRFEPLPERAEFVAALAEKGSEFARTLTWDDVEAMAIPSHQPAWRGA
jgi:hypothetical protein